LKGKFRSMLGRIQAKREVASCIPLGGCGKAIEFSVCATLMSLLNGMMFATGNDDNLEGEKGTTP
jgi:hypothetical protein